MFKNSPLHKSKRLEEFNNIELKTRYSWVYSETENETKTFFPDRIQYLWAFGGNREWQRLNEISSFVYRNYICLLFANPSWLHLVDKTYVRRIRKVWNKFNKLAWTGRLVLHVVYSRNLIYLVWKPKSQRILQGNFRQTQEMRFEKN